MDGLFPDPRDDGTRGAVVWPGAATESPSFHRPLGATVSLPGLDTTSSSGLLWIGRNGVEGLPRFSGILRGRRRKLGKPGNPANRATLCGAGR